MLGIVTDFERHASSHCSDSYRGLWESEALLQVNEIHKFASIKKVLQCSSSSSHLPVSPSLHSWNYNTGPFGALNYLNPAVSASNYYLVTPKRIHTHNANGNLRRFSPWNTHQTAQDHNKRHFCVFCFSLSELHTAKLAMQGEFSLLVVARAIACMNEFQS